MAFESISKLWFVAAGLIGTVAYFVALLIRRRSFYRGLPCPPHSLFWGHLKLVGEYTQKLPAGIHMQYILTQIKLDYDLPDVFYLDLWPAGPRFIVCSDPDACAIATTVNNFEQPAVVTKFFRGNLGDGFIEATNGAVWKALHRMLAPGLTPNAVKEYYGSVIDQAVVFQKRLRDITTSVGTFDLRYELGKYPFNVVNSIVFGENPVPQLYEDISKSADIQAAVHATQNPLEKRRLGKDITRCFTRVNAIVEEVARNRFKVLQQGKEPVAKSGVISMLDRMLSSQVQSGRPLDSSFLELIYGNVNGFFVAGYGTTTDTSCYIWMLLSEYPEALKKLREEHDRIFDKDFDKTVKMLRENPNLTKELEYTTGVINEALRMFPVGFSCRSPPPDMLTMEHNGRAYPIEGHIVAIASQTMHWDAKYFEEPKTFMPERFMGDPSYPRSAYRPFERGVRACLGQALAMDEMKIMLVLVARWFDFEMKEKQTVQKPVLSFMDLEGKLGKHAYQAWSFTAGVPGTVMMKPSFVKR